MKKFKRLFSFAITMIVAISCFGFNTFAEPMLDTPTGTITVKNDNANVSIDGKKYEAYRLFNASENVNDGRHTTAYIVADKFKPFFTTAAFTSKFPSAGIDASKIDSYADFVASLTTAQDIELFANLVYDWIKANPTALAKYEATASGETAVFKDENDSTALPLGYYAIYGIAKNNDNSRDLNTAVSLGSNAYNDGTYAVEVKAKVDAPSLTKKIIDPSESGLPNYDYPRDAESYKIGSTVNFLIKSKVPDLTGFAKRTTGERPETQLSDYVFVVNDTLGKGFEYDGNYDVYIGGQKYDSNRVLMNKSTDADGNTNITFNFKNLLDDYLDKETYSNVVTGNDIQIFYSAKLTKDAVYGANGNPNEAYLEFSNDPHSWTTDKSTKDEVKVYAFVIDVLKYTAINKGSDNEELLPLKDAKFKLTDSDGVEEFAFVKTENGYRLWTSDDPADKKVTELVTDENGKLYLAGLKDGAYRLVETAAPAGYKTLTEPVEIIITANYIDQDNNLELNADAPILTGDNTTVLEDRTGVHAEIENVPGSSLPTTGGIGTTIIYICGGALILAAIIYFTVKKLAKSK